MEHVSGPSAIAAPQDAPPDAVAAALARSDRMQVVVPAILRHLMGEGDNALLHDDVLAHMRGMLDHLAECLLARAESSASRPPLALVERLTQALSESEELLAHLHAVALEWRVTRRLEARGLTEPVLTPLLQDLVASGEDRAQTAMAFVSAQARFVQSSRRLQLDWRELPADLLHHCLVCLRALERNGAIDSARAVQSIRSEYDEAASRQALAETLIAQLSSLNDTLDPEQAGFALFATGLAAAARTERKLAVVACSESDPIRLGLLLLAAGADRSTCEASLLAIRQEATLPSGLLELDRRAAARLLDATGPA